MYNDHSTPTSPDIVLNDERGRVLYEATGFARLHEAYGLHDEQDWPREGQLSRTSVSPGPPGDSYCSDASSSCCSTGASDTATSCELDLPPAAWADKEDSTVLLKPGAELDDDSEDEVTHKPISAREVIEHNKMFGKRTADYWWVHGDRVYSDYFVALLRPMTAAESADASRADARDVKRALANAPTLSETLEDLDKALSRFELRLGRPPAALPAGDPNLQRFPTPHDFTPSDLRKWTRDWKQFDFTLEPWPCVEEPIDLSDPGDENIHKERLRPWLDEWVPFDTEVTGECAWTCLELSVIERDIPTNKQLRVIAARQCRVDMFDPRRVEKRRQKLAEYFKEKYKKTDVELEQYSRFLPSLKENARQLLSLC